MANLQAIKFKDYLLLYEEVKPNMSTLDMLFIITYCIEKSFLAKLPCSQIFQFNWKVSGDYEE